MSFWTEKARPGLINFLNTKVVPFFKERGIFFWLHPFDVVFWMSVTAVVTHYTWQ